MWHVLPKFTRKLLISGRPQISFRKQLSHEISLSVKMLIALCQYVAPITHRLMEVLKKKKENNSVQVCVYLLL